MALQQTLAAPCEFPPGIGLHSGAPVRMRCLPAAEGSGVRFRRVDLPGAPELPAAHDNVDEENLNRRTVLTNGRDTRVDTVEHLLAACQGLGIDNLLVELDGPEPPFYDGSAAPLADVLAAAGTRVLSAPREPFPIPRPFAFTEAAGEIVALPGQGLRATYFADFPTPIGQMCATFEITPETFLREIAPARTFCFEHEIPAMREAGLIRGGSDDCAVIYGAQGPINAVPRFEDEPARHKLLDLLGDLALFGRPLRGHIMAWRTGHRTHAAFLKALRKEFAP